MKKKNHHYDNQKLKKQKQNIPVTLKNNTRGTNTSYNNETNQNSLDSPIKRLKLSQQSRQSRQSRQSLHSLNDSNPQNINSQKNQKANKKKSQKNLRLKEKKYKDKDKEEYEQEWPYEQQISEEQKVKKKQNDLSKIQLGSQKIIELPVQKASQDQYLSQDYDDINEMTQQKSQPLNKQKSPTFNNNIQQIKRSITQIPSNFQFSRLKQHKSDRAQIKHSRSITDSIMSPQFQKYLGQSQKSNFRHKISNPLYPHKGYHHNQCPIMVQSETLPKPQNAHYRTTFIKQELKLTLANNLDKILFKYNGGHARILYNNKLKIKNDSPVNVQVKILCTSPSHYQVRPYSNVILCPSQVLNVLIQMKLYVHDINNLTMKHDLTRYKNDKFKIGYWSNDFGSEIWYEHGEKILPVVIEDTEEEIIRSKGLIENQTNEEMKMIAGQKNIEMYKNMIEKTKKKIQLLDCQIKDVQKNQVHSKYFTKSLFWLVAIIGAAIGYWLG